MDPRRSRYTELQQAFPERFVNPPDAPFTILLDAEDIAAAEKAAGEQLTARGLPASWGLTGVLYEDPYLVIVRDAVRTPSGRPGVYVRQLTPGEARGVVILPRCGDDVVLIRHFRHSTRSWHLEVPRGFGTPGSTPEADARRELLEEIGAVPTALHPLGEVYPDSGLAGTPVHLFYAEIEDFATGEVDEGIDQVRRVSLAELGELVGSGEISDGFTIAAYTRASLRGHL